MPTRDYDQWLSGKLATDPKDAAAFLRVHAEDPEIDIDRLRAVAVLVADALERYLYEPAAKDGLASAKPGGLQHGSESGRPRNMDLAVAEHHPFKPAMEALCASLPCIRGMAGTKPWAPVVLAEGFGSASGGERACIQFVLCVWNCCPGEWSAFNIPPFGIAEFARLDDDHRKVIAEWFTDPFWP